ncbi:MAG TPA: SH3 domain-containing protein [Phototrophicaceae bacterium]|nr:SH3 domain-containing protein [Phototrophicaceae bacterium]
MRKWFLLIAVSLLFVVFAAIAYGDPDAPQPGETIVGIAEFDGIRIYSGPDFAYPVIGELAKDTSVTILGRRGDFIYAWDGTQWYEISFESGSAWVYARLLRTSIPFNSIFPTGRPLPRNRDGVVPPAFDLTDDICDSWTGQFTRTGDFMQGDTQLTVTYPALPGATVYSVISISPNGTRRASDSTSTTAIIKLDDLPHEGGTYTWRVAPYWSNSTRRSDWQQICLLQTGGTFDVPFPIVTLEPTRPFYRYYYIGPTLTPGPTPTPIPFVA